MTSSCVMFKVSPVTASENDEIVKRAILLMYKVYSCVKYQSRRFFISNRSHVNNSFVRLPLLSYNSFKFTHLREITEVRLTYCILFIECFAQALIEIVKYRRRKKTNFVRS